MAESPSLFQSLRDDLALVNDIPLYAIPDDAPFTLDQQLAFGRVTDALPALLDRYGDAVSALRLCREVVERYGNYWCKDDAYYAVSAALGIEEPSDASDRWRHQ